MSRCIETKSRRNRDHLKVVGVKLSFGPLSLSSLWEGGVSGRQGVNDRQDLIFHPHSFNQTDRSPLGFESLCAGLGDRGHYASVR